MIRAGRETVDRWGVAALHGLTESQARRRRPWSESNHPAPINGVRTAGGAPMLWDRVQAAAFANGDPSPVLPTIDSDGDLLDLGEFADLAEIEANTLLIYVRDGYAPDPDEHLHGVAHWRRGTARDWLTSQRAGRGRGGGRRARDPQTRRTAEHERVRQALAAAPDESLPDLAARARVSRATAAKYRRLESEAGNHGPAEG